MNPPAFGHGPLIRPVDSACGARYGATISSKERNRAACS